MSALLGEGGGHRCSSEAPPRARAQLLGSNVAAGSTHPWRLRRRGPEAPSRPGISEEEEEEEEPSIRLEFGLWRTEEGKHSAHILRLFAPPRGALAERKRGRAGGREGGR